MGLQYFSRVRKIFSSRDERGSADLRRAGGIPSRPSDAPSSQDDEVKSDESCAFPHERENKSLVDINWDRPSWDGLSPDPIGVSPYSRVLIYRDYSQGFMKFSDQIPPVLSNNMQVEERCWNRTMEEINKICAETEVMNWKSVSETLGDCFGYHSIFTNRKTQYEKCLERLSLYIQDQNRRVYDRFGLELMDPQLNGYRFIEVVVKYLRFRTTMPILQWGKDYPTNPKLEAWEIEEDFSV